MPCYVSSYLLEKYGQIELKYFDVPYGPFGGDAAATSLVTFGL